MSEAIYYNGSMGDKRHSADRSFVCRHVRTLGHRAILLDEHLEQLDIASYNLFGRASALSDTTTTAEAIASLLEHNGYSDKLSHIIMLRAYADGNYEIECIETSIYDTLTLRALRPIAVAIRAYDECATFPSSATLATALLHREQALRQGADVAITVDAEGRIGAIDGAEAVMVINGRLIFSSRATAPEYKLLMRCALNLGREIECREIEEKELLRADEVWFVDYRGITALASYGSRHYADIVAERLARHLDQFFR